MKYWIFVFMLFLVACSEEVVVDEKELVDYCNLDHELCDLETCKNCCSGKYYEDYVDHIPCNCTEGVECLCASATYCGEKTPEKTKILEISQGSLKISCPTSVVCDTNYFYHALEYKEDNNWILFSFKPELAAGYNYESFVEHFNYANFKLYLAEFSSEGKEVYVQNTYPKREIKFVSYENNILEGIFEYPITKLRWETEEICLYDDIMKNCIESEDVNFILEVKFKLEVEE